MRSGDYVPSRFPIAFLSVDVEGAEAAILSAVTLRRRPASLQDLEFAAGPGIWSTTALILSRERAFRLAAMCSRRRRTARPEGCQIQPEVTLSPIAGRCDVPEAALMATNPSIDGSGDLLVGIS